MSQTLFSSASAIAPFPVAIVGIGCRFPGGADSPDALWKLLCEGVDAVREVPEDRWKVDGFYDPEPGKPGKTYAKWGGFIDGIDQFDARFFGISPREADLMDPQQRLLLEATWEAIEDGGQVLDLEAGSNTGVFIGISTTDYSLLQSSPNEAGAVDAYATTGSANSIAANRLSYCFNFLGPSVAIDTACSSALVALHAACRSLRNGDCTMAVAGGVNALLDARAFIAFSSMSMLSPDGKCKAFDAAANGFVRGEGAGVILLKPLETARAAGDRIYAVISATGANQDGRSAGLTVPSFESQKSLIETVCREARVEAADIQYAEAHGTGTAVGDPIEGRALGAALGHGRTAGDECVIGSIKTNIGHLEAAAGIAGVIKVALMLKHGGIPPSLHFHT
ncbi:MAG TPA: polyketide synthase, partial [Chthoniobacterales bacterium]